MTTLEINMGRYTIEQPPMTDIKISGNGNSHPAWYTHMGHDVVNLL